MKRLIIPVSAGVVALAGTVALALGPNSRAEWGVDGTAGGVLSVQRAPVVERGQTTGVTAKPVDAVEQRTPTVGAEAAAGPVTTPEPGTRKTPEATKEPTSTSGPVTVEPEEPPTVAATSVPSSQPVPTDPVKAEPTATKPVEPRVAKEEPAKAVEARDDSLGTKATEPSKDASNATTVNAKSRDRAR